MEEGCVCVCVCVCGGGVCVCVCVSLNAVYLCIIYLTAVVIFITFTLWFTVNDSITFKTTLYTATATIKLFSNTTYVENRKVEEHFQ